MFDTWEKWVIAGLAVIIIGIAKVGFGGGLGILTTPLLIMVIPAKESVGILLPILCACDMAALWHYWRDWDRRNVALLLPGAVAGIALGAYLLGKSNDAQLGLAIGVICVAFVARHVWIEIIRRGEGPAFQPSLATGTAFGLAGGVTSTLAHAAGPVTVMFLLPQKMSRMRFVGTTVVYFTFVNAFKLPPYWYLKMINWNTLASSARLLPFVPVGVILGIWLNRNVNERWFGRIVYVILFLAGVELVVKNAMKLFH